MRLAPSLLIEAKLLACCCFVFADVAVRTAVCEVDHEANRKPDHEACPRQRYTHYMADSVVEERRKQQEGRKKP